MDGYFELLSGEIGLEFGEESELEVTGFDDGADVFVHFEGVVEKHTKVFRWINVQQIGFNDMASNSDETFVDI